MKRESFSERSIRSIRSIVSVQTRNVSGFNQRLFFSYWRGPCSVHVPSMFRLLPHQTCDGGRTLQNQGTFSPKNRTNCVPGDIYFPGTGRILGQEGFWDRGQPRQRPNPLRTCVSSVVDQIRPVQVPECPPLCSAEAAASNPGIK